jgi:hypothetical protein
VKRQQRPRSTVTARHPGNSAAGPNSRLDQHWFGCLAASGLRLVRLPLRCRCGRDHWPARFDRSRLV